MIAAVQRASIFALYQMSIAIGILLLPIALIARLLGITLPIHHVVDRLGEAYTDAGHPN